MFTGHRNVLLLAFSQALMLSAIVMAMALGAVLGGMVLGLMEAFAASYLSILTGGAFGAEYKDVFAFLVLILILVFRPKGILGEKVREEGV